MTTVKLAQIERHYSNNGQHAEQVVVFTLTGEMRKADNRPFTTGGDCGDLQIKSSRATICHGTNIQAHIEMDGAKRYGYVTADFEKMFVMSPIEYLEFATMFGTVTRESKKNGGTEKIRLKPENQKMLEWFMERT